MKKYDKKNVGLRNFLKNNLYKQKHFLDLFKIPYITPEISLSNRHRTTEKILQG